MDFPFSVCPGLVLITAIGIVGCGDRQPTGKVVATVPAQGILLHQGKPLPFYSIIFIPDGDRSAGGISDEEGHFVLGTNRPNDGAVPGTHRVAINYVGNPEEDPLPKGIVTIGTPPPVVPRSMMIDKKYQTAATSGITVEIPRGGNANLEIDLK